MEQLLQQPLTLAELASKIGAELASNAVAHSQVLITRLSTLETASEGCISFLANPIYKKYLPSTKASAVVLAPSDAEGCSVPVLISKNPRLSLAKLLHLCEGAKRSLYSGGVHPTAVIGSNVTLGHGVTIGPNCFVGDNCVIGDDTVLMPNVVVYHGVTMGKRCRIHSGTVLGSDGFGYAVDATGQWVKMLHLGSVVLGDDVEIGSNTSIDRGMIDNTVIGNGVIIDNLVQIGHNVTIGDFTAIAGCVGIAGSTHIGKYCLIGGASSIQGHIFITDKVHITGTSSVSNSILEPGVYSSGLPARKNELWRRSVVRFMNLDKMALRIRELEKAMNMDNVNETNHGYQK